MTPEQTLTAAAEHVLGPYRPIDDGYLAEAIAKWLDAAAKRERAAVAAAARVYTTPAEQAAWLADHRDHHALAVARQILGDQA